jgi:hypothetical protein
MADFEYEFLRPIVAGWLGKLAAANKAKEEFRDTADQCMQFFSGAVGWCWEDKFRRKFLGANIAPKFRVSINKAFELVALFGPMLYNQNPERCVRPFKRIEYGPEVFGDPNDQMVQQQFQQATQFDQWRRSRVKTGCQIIEQYLSYTPNEQPNGGLAQASGDAITEMLIKGRGLLWPATYTHPGSNRVLTGCFYDSVDRFYSDPDATSINFGDAKFVIKETIAPYWEVERKFQLEPGTLKKTATLSSGEAQGAIDGNPLPNLTRQRGEAHDLVRYWEIYSICGAGTRLTGVSQDLEEAFDDWIGDYCYLAVAAGVPWPLNAPVERLRTATQDEARRMFDWPIPYYADGRWPCAILDAYREPNMAWPIAPLKPGLGELTAINVFMSFLCNRAWQGSRTIVGVLESAKAAVEKALGSNDDLVVLGIKEIHADIDRVLKEWQHKDVTGDSWKIIQALMNLFEKRTGLTDLWYGTTDGATPRVTEDVKQKNQKSTIRIDHYVSKVDEWQREAARMEKQAAYWGGVRGDSVAPLLGPVGAQLWDQLFVGADPETVIYEMECTVTPGSSKRPNRERDAANLAQMYQPLSQQFGQYAVASTNTGPLNTLNKLVFDSIQMDGDGLQMGPWAPPPPPPPPPGPPPPPPPDPKDMLKLQFMQAQGQQKLAQKDQQHQQKLAMKQQDQMQKLMAVAAMQRLKRLGAENLPQEAAQ